MRLKLDKQGMNIEGIQTGSISENKGISTGIFNQKMLRESLSVLDKVC